MKNESQGQENDQNGSSLSNGPTTTTSTQQQEERQKEQQKEEEKSEIAEDEMDEEGLVKKGYDVILCGTGLTQSIVAAALARAGKSILHCDSNEFYGDLDAVHSLGSLRDWRSKVVSNRTSCEKYHGDDEDDEKGQATSPGHFISLESSECYSSLTIDSESNVMSDYNHAISWEKGMKVETQYGVGTLLATAPTEQHDQPIESLPVELDDWILANGKRAVVYIGRKNQQLTQNSWDLVPYDVILYREYVEKRQRSFALDIAPRLLLANGEAVDGIVQSGVNEYCEFKSILGLYLFTTTTQQEGRKKSSRGGKELRDDEQVSTLHRVPCSKRDVFQTKLLSPMDKRRLMNFLQIAADYAVSLSLSLQRQDEEPRNAGIEGDIDTDTNANSKAVVGEDMVLSLNERQLRQGRSLHRPQNKTVATLDMETLQQCIKEDMSFGTYLKKHHKLSDNMIDIIIYAMAMYSSSNEKGCEYSTKDGMRDLCKHLQSLGKYGSTAFLTPLYGSGELSQAFCRCAAVHGGTYLLRRGPTRIQLDANGGVCGVKLPSNDNEDGQGKSEKLILAKHVVAPLQMIKQNGRKTRRVCRRISIVRGPIVLTNTTEQDATTNEQRHIIIIPPGDQCLCNDYVIHGLVLDESVNVAPRSVSRDIPPITVLHLSTFENVHNEGNSSNGSGATVLRNAAQSLYGKHCVELYQLTFSHDLYDHKEINVCDSPGLHVCRPSREGTLVVDNLFVEARRIFEEICPNDTFLMLSSEMGELLKERLAGMHDDGDEEVQMLESAMSMVKASDQS